MIKIRRWRSTIVYSCLLFSVILLLNLFAISSVKVNTNTNFRSNQDKAAYLKEEARLYVAYGKDVDSGHLHHVFDILALFGYKRASITEAKQWDIMWAHEYPFKNLSSTLRNLEPYQKVNHFPGSGFITNKMDLSTSGLPYTPKAFRLPMEKDRFFKHVSKYPNMKYVVKSNDHRGIKILEIEDINFNENGIFIQEYIDNPLLVDGFKFDIGVYTIISSLDPLRVYIYDGDTLFRYCTEKYHPFDASKTEKYVIGDDYLPTWEVPSLRKYYTEFGMSMKASFNAYLTESGYDHKKIWKNIDEAIRLICLKKEPLMVNLLSSYKSKRNFFELMRFDFVVDADLNVFLMEVNMSPNLSSLHFRPNQLLYEQVLLNLFSLVGLGLHQRIGVNNRALVADKNIAISSLECKNCMDCSEMKCQLCFRCLSPVTKNILKLSYLEHVNKRDCKRVFPCNWKKKAEMYGLKLSHNNDILMKWFQEKCEEDAKWCC